MTPPRSVSALSDAAILSAWEDGQQQPLPERALVLLDRADTSSAGAPEGWSIGQRDAQLLALHAATFGRHVAGTALCPRCGQQLDVAFDVDDVRAGYGHAGQGLELTTTEPRRRILFRLPTSADLRAVAGAETVEIGRRVLAGRCIVAVEGDPIQPDAVPVEIVDLLAAAMARHDPQADIRLDMTCPECGESWQMSFDPADFLWREVEARAEELLADVHTLAAAYGWSEADVLAMSPVRRQAYLDFVLT